jgi:VWFA-related protein
MTRTSLGFRFFLSIGVLLLGAGVVHPAGQQGQQPPARTLTGGAGEPISVDFLAVTKDGQPIIDLKLGEVQLRVDGKARVLKSLQVMGGGSDAPSSAGEPPPAPFASNAIADGGRAIVLVVDDETLRLGNEQPMKDAIAQLLTSLPPRDRVALVTVPHGGLKVDFTTDRSKVRGEVSKILGQPAGADASADAADRTRTTLVAMSGLFDSLGGSSLGPTTVVLFSSSMSGVRGTTGISTFTRVGAGDIQQLDFEHVGDAAAAARVQLYVVEHDATITGREGLLNLTGVTGGVLLGLSGAGTDTALTRVARETSAYYVATFEPDAADRTGSTHQLSVKVTRDGAVVRARDRLPIGKAGAEMARPTPMSPHAMLLDSRAYRDMPLRTVAYAARYASDGRIKVVVVTESGDGTSTIAAAEAGLFDQAGHLAAQWTPGATDLGSSQVLAALVVKPGTYRLRMAATDATGRRATTDCDVTAELTPAGVVNLSDLAVGLSRSNAFVPRLQFTTEPVALAFLQIYTTPKTEAMAVMIEVARSLNGPAFLTMPAAIAATGDEDRFTVTAAIPIGGLEPGDYVIRALVGKAVGDDFQPAGRVVRTLRKVAK